MKKLIILILLLPHLCFAEVTTDEILGEWKLISESTFLTMTFNKNGYVSVTMGKINGPFTGLLGTWSSNNEILKIVLDNKNSYEYKSIKKQGGFLSAINLNGVVERFEYTPPHKSLNQTGTKDK